MFSNFQCSYSKEKVDGEKSQLWWDLMQQIVSARPDKKRYKKPKEQSFREKCFNVVTHEYFVVAIYIVIILNLITMTMEHENSTETFYLTLEWISTVFTLIFIFEAVLKLIAFGVEDYFYEDWNKFDFTVVILDIVDIFFIFYGREGSGFAFTGLFKTLQVMRVFRIIRVIRYYIIIKLTQIGSSN